MAHIVAWEEPPPHGNTQPRKAYKWQPVADALREHPKRWAVVAEGITPGSAGGLAHRIANGWTAFQPAGAYEAKVRGSGSAAKVYARYVGDSYAPSGEDA